MHANAWTYWVYLIQDGERYGFLIGRRGNPNEPIRYEYFYPDGPDGLSPGGACLQFLSEDAVHPPDPSTEVTKFLALLKKCVLHANRGDSLSRCIECEGIRGIGNDPADPFRKLFDFKDKKTDTLRHERSPLRNFFVSYDAGFAKSVLQTSKRRFHVKAEAFEQLTPDEVEERIFDRTALFQSIRALLSEDSLQHLRQQLRTDNISDYIPHELEIGHIPQEDGLLQRMQQVPLEMGREWHVFSTDQFDLQGRRFLLTSVSGAGKTTFLRHAQRKMLSSTDKLAVFFRAKDLHLLRPLRWPRIRSLLVECFDSLARPSVLQTFLDGLWNKGRFVIIVDALDNLGDASTNCIDLVSDLLREIGDNTLILAGRPTVAGSLQDREDVDLLRLRPYDEKSCRDYFGDFYDTAHTLCRGNMQFLTTPMLAYMLRSLSKTHPSDIVSLWDLYSAFLKYILHRHPSNLQDRNHRQWAHDIRHALGAISYHAVNQQDPEWVVISDSTAHAALKSLPGDTRVSIDALSSAGLADFIDSDGLLGEASLVFSHQSFQEFLAADWASRDEDRINHVLGEYWNPKWKEVLRFLCGTDKGSSILSRLYRGPEHDNPIHARLFLTAEIAKECHESHDLHSILLNTLKNTLELQPFTPHCLIALTKLLPQEANDWLWTQLRYGRFMSAFSADTLGAIKALYRTDRLHYILNSNSLFDDDHYLWILLAWGSHITGSSADTLIDILDRSPSNSLPFPYVFHEMAQNLTRRQLNRLLHMFVHPTKPEYRDMAVCAAIEGLGRRLEPTDITRVIQAAIYRYHTYPNIYYVLRRLDQFKHVRKYHIDLLLKKFTESRDPKELLAVANILTRVNQWLNDADISLLVRKAIDKANPSRSLSLRILEGIMHKAPLSAQRDVCSILDDSDIAASRQATITVASMNRYLEEQLRSSLLSRISTDMCIAPQVIRHLRNSLAKEDVAPFVRNAITTPCSSKSVEVCALCHWLLTDTDITQLIPRLVDFACVGSESPYLNTFPMLKSRLTQEHVSLIVDEIESRRTGVKIMRLVELINERTISENDTKRLFKCFLDETCETKESIYKKLRDVHINRGLLDTVTIETL